MAALYSAAVSLLLVAHFTVGERRKVVALLNTAMHWLTLFCFVALLVIQLSPYRVIWTLYAIPGCIAFLVWYGPLFLPRRFTTADNDDQHLQLRVFTYNIAHLGDQFAATLDQIRQFDADIIGLQESVGWRVAQPEVPGYPYQLNIMSYTLLSRYPFDITQTLLLGVVPGRTMPVGIRTVLNIDGTSVAVYVVHPKRPQLSIRPLRYNGRERREGVADLLWHLHNDDYPVLMIGDCNMGYRSEDYRLLARVLTDSWRVRGFGLGLTAPAGPNDAPFPLLRSDIIWHSHHFTTRRVGVWSHAGSADHYPVWAEVILSA